MICKCECWLEPVQVFRSETGEWQKGLNRIKAKAFDQAGLSVISVKSRLSETESFH